MCYSKEVSLAAGTVIISLSYWWYFKFYVQQGISQLKIKIPTNIRNFNLWFLLGFASIGGHQIAEFISIAWQSEFIYKAGLISSILCTYFMVVAFEKLSGKKFASWLLALSIFILGIDVFSTDMVFQNQHFWVRGFSHQRWAILWLMQWLYLWGVIGILGFKAVHKDNKRFYLFTALLGINISFILSWIYAIVAHRYGTICSLSNCSYHFLQEFMYNFDFPSLWCTLTVLQAPFIYWVLHQATKTYKKENFNDWNPTWLTIVGLICVSVLGMVIWYISTPLALGVSWKMLTK